MGNDGWPEVRLGDVCEKIGSGATPRGGGEVYLSTGDISLIRSQNVHNDGFQKEGLAFIEEKHARELENVTVQQGDILLNITGDSVARTCQAPGDVLPARVNQHVAIIRPRKDSLDARYLHYYLVSPPMQQYMLALAAAGATRNALTKGMIESFKIPAPPLPIQRAISDVLGAMDDKIEINRRMNKTLEAIARALFRSWFVDFDPVRAKAMGRQPTALDAKTAALFPDAFDASQLGKLPRGWGVATIGDVCELAYGKGLKESERRIGDTPVYGSNGQIGWHNEALVKGPGIVVGRKGNPGTVTWVQKDFFPIDTTFYVVPKGKVASMYWLYHALSLQNLPALGADSAVPGLNRNIAYLPEWIVAIQVVIEAFDGYVKPMFDKISSADDESRTLAALRDALLPKLMNGEMRVEEIEQEI
jgi:type I restriction enzyme S subunit